MQDLLELAKDIGFSHSGYVNMESLIPMNEIRDMCAVNKCGRFGTSWSCPPACGSIEETTLKIKQYDSGILVQTTGIMSDDFDYETIKNTEIEHKKHFTDFIRQIRMICDDPLPLSAGTCTVCKSCTYPDKPCRFPNKCFSSMEAYGLFVSDICTKSDIKYNYGPKTMTYTSCVLFCKEKLK